MIDMPIGNTLRVIMTTEMKRGRKTEFEDFVIRLRNHYKTKFDNLSKLSRKDMRRALRKANGNAVNAINNILMKC